MDEICDLIESVSEGFPIYSFSKMLPKAVVSDFSCKDYSCKHYSCTLQSLK